MKKFLVVVFVFIGIVVYLFPLGVIPSGATGEGVDGFFYNPASLGFNANDAVSLDLRYLSPENYNLSLFWGSNLGIISTVTDGKFSSYRFLFGVGYPIVDNLYLGYDASVDYVMDSWTNPVYNLGILSVPLNWLSLGVYQKNITGGEKSTLNFSVGLRPLYFLGHSPGIKLTLFGDVNFPFDPFNPNSVSSEFGENFINSLTYSAGLELEPLDGLDVGVKLNDWNHFEAGVGFTTGDLDFYVSMDSDFNLSGYTFNFGMRLNKKPRKTIFRFPSPNYVVKLSHPFEASSVNKYSLYNIDSFVSQVYRLANDKSCKTLYIVFDHPVVGSIGNLEKIKDAYFYFTGRGKRIITYINNSFSQLDYLAAACGSEIVIPPTGFIFLSGVGAEFLFFKNLFDREGIEVEYSRSSNYKSALDTFIRKKLSKENRKQYTAYLKTVYRLFLEILKKRGFDVKKANQIIDNGPYDARTARRAGLVDKLMYYDDFEKRYIKKKAAVRVKVIEYAKRDWKEKPVIAVFKLSGPVVNSASISPINYLFGGSYITEKNTIPFIRMVERDDRIKALIVQLDSPGGDGVISDEIWNALVKLKKKKPVVIVMGSVAASGGYYIAIAGDYIIAEKTTLTGSIGAFSYKYVIKKLLKKYGITTDSITFGKNYTLFSPFDKLTKKQKKKMEELTNFFVKQFYMKVAKARKLSLKQVEKIGGGRIYSGEEALKLKLIDKIGGLRDAISYVERRLKLSKEMCTVEYYPDKKALMQMFIKNLDNSDVNVDRLLDGFMLKALFLKPLL